MTTTSASFSAPAQQSAVAAVVTRSSHTATMLLGVASFGALAIALFNILAPASSTAEDWAGQVSFVVLGWLLVYVGCTYATYRTLYLFSTVYLVLLCQFHLSITIAQSLGFYHEIKWANPVGTNWLALSGWYVVLTLGAFGIGFAVASAVNHCTVRAPDAALQRGALQRGVPLAWWAGTGLLIASIIFVSMAFAAVGSLLLYSRADLFRGVGDTRGVGAFLMVFPSALMLLLIGARPGWQRAAAWILAIAGLSLVMLSGYRTYALAPLLTAAIVWVKTGRRVPVLLAAGGLILMVLAISFIGVLRQAGTYGSFTEQSFERAWTKSSGKDTVLLGSTGGVLAQVLRFVPATDPYRHGMTYLNAVVEAVPNITPKLRESSRLEAKGRSNIDPDAIASLDPSDWITYRINRWAYDVGQGVGFTAIGEAYLNFGTVGVIAVFMLLGFWFQRLESIDLLAHPWWLFFCCAMLWHLMRTVRDDFTNFTKPALFTLIVLGIWAVLGRTLMPRRAPRA
jgi:oligosaccharide repeat unit polymerase